MRHLVCANDYFRCQERSSAHSSCGTHGMLGAAVKQMVDQLIGPPINQCYDIDQRGTEAEPRESAWGRLLRHRHRGGPNRGELSLLEPATCKGLQAGRVQLV